MRQPAGGRASSGAASFCLHTLHVPDRTLVVHWGPWSYDLSAGLLRRKQGGRGRLGFPPPPTLFDIILGVHVECKKPFVPNTYHSCFWLSRELLFIIYIKNCLSFLNAFRSISNCVLMLGLPCWHLSGSRRGIILSMWKVGKQGLREVWWITGPCSQNFYIRDWAGTWTQISRPSLCLTAQIGTSTFQSSQAFERRADGSGSLPIPSSLQGVAGPSAVLDEKSQLWFFGLDSLRDHPLLRNLSEYPGLGVRVDSPAGPLGHKLQIRHLDLSPSAIPYS